MLTTCIKEMMQMYVVINLGKGNFEVRGIKQEKTYYIVNIKNGCSCGRKDCVHKKAVEEWMKKNF